MSISSAIYKLKEKHKITYEIINFFFNSLEPSRKLLETSTVLMNPLLLKIFYLITAILIFSSLLYEMTNTLNSQSVVLVSLTYYITFCQVSSVLLLLFFKF